MYDYEWDRLKIWLAQYGVVDGSVESAEDITRLDLSAKSLKELPESIGILSHLLVLNLANNKLSKLPESIKNLKSLRNLDIRRNSFETLPDVIELLNISSLNASGNHLKCVAISKKFRELRVLDLSANTIGSLEILLVDENELRTLNISANLIKNITPIIKTLGALERLDVSSNLLNEIPEEIVKLKSIENIDLSSNKIQKIHNNFFNLDLEIVDLSANSLKELSLYSLNSLEEITLDENDFVSLTLEDNFAPYLKKFSCDSCSLKEFLLPQSRLLEYLSYASNSISSIPDAISKYNKLKYLDLEENKIEILPDALANLVYLQIFYARGNPLHEGTKKVLEVLSPNICDLTMKFGIDIETPNEDDLIQMAKLLGTLFMIERDFQIDYEKQLSGIQRLYNTAGTDLLVAKHEGKVIGMVTMQRLISSAEGDYIGQIEDLVVDEEYRKMGVASRLLNKIRVIAQEHKYKRIQLAADMDNSNALAFYNRRGFNKTNLNIYHYIT
jgi:Leucine-rich repeat (LRR) protein